MQNRNEYDNREARLPRWVQDRLTSLRRELTDAETHVAKLQGEAPEDSDTFLDPFVQTVPLGRGPTVRYSLGDHRYVDVRIRDGRLDIHGETQIHFSPRSSNSGSISVHRD